MRLQAALWSVLFLAAVSAGSLASAVADEAPDLDTVVERIIEAYGGAEALSRVGVMRQTGRTQSTMRDETGTMSRIVQGAGRLRFEITYPNEQTELRLLDGKEGWRDGAAAEGPLYDSMRLQAARIALPMLLLERRDSLKGHGFSMAQDGSVYYVIEVPIDQHVVLYLAIDPETWRIRHSEGVIRPADSPPMRFSTTYNDYRSWNGILIAAREDQYAMGQYTGHTVIEDVEFPNEADSALFRP